MKDIFIVSAKRTPLGSWGGALKKFSATELGSMAIKGALEAAGVDPKKVHEVFMGNVVSANLGQAPAKQMSLGAGIPNRVPTTTVNKVCASGMKAVMLGAQTIAVGHADLVVAGGSESMSNIPFYVPTARWGNKFGDTKMIDGLTRDGLMDAYDHCAMGVCADATAKKYKFTREEQDAFAIQSYKRAAAATDSGELGAEIVPISIPQRKGDPILMSADEEYKKVMFEKIPKLRAAFTKDGTVTAANASTINDGAAALVLASAKAVKQYGLTPIAKIRSFADASHEPRWFTTAPVKAAPIALRRAKVKAEDIDFWEVNEAFSVVTMAFAKEFGLDASKVNAFGGAVSLGHPLGASGARILVTLANVLQQKKGTLGCAAICNGGGGASSMVIEKL